MRLEELRLKVRQYRQYTGKTQNDLAAQIGLQPKVLSHKLNGSDNSRLTHQDIKRIVKVLAEWEGITRQDEALEILELAGLRYNSFSEEEWTAPPLNTLTKLETPAASAALVAAPVAPVAPVARSTNLPAYLNSFVGRTREVEQLVKMLQQPAVRLVTLTGAGGVGKTRLSLQLASRLLPHFPDGVFLVALASVTKPAQVLSSLAQVLGIKETSNAALLDTLKLVLGSKKLLLVLDNFEQVVSAANLLVELLAAAPSLKMVVTSRFTLNLYGENEFKLTTLSLPETTTGLTDNAQPELWRDWVQQYEALRLFEERARAVQPNFALTSENLSTVIGICRRLDGLPLAIELAAARLRFFTPQMLLKRLDSRLKVLVGGGNDLPARQQTLYNAIDWSYSLLDETESKLFCWLAVFSGGCKLEAAESLVERMLENSSDELPVTERLAGLVDKSLLLAQSAGPTDPQTRYLMLATIREFALEKLAALPEKEKVYLYYGQHFVRLAEQAEPLLEGKEQIEWLNWLEDEHDNLQTVLSYAIDQLEGTQGTTWRELGLRLAGSLAQFWAIRGYLSEGREYLTQLIKRLPPPGVASESKLIQAKALTGAGLLARLQGDYEAAHAYFQQALQLQGNQTESREIATLLNNLGYIAQERSNYQEARRLHQESLQIQRKLGDWHGVAGSLNSLGILAFEQGDYQKASALWQESLLVVRRFEDKRRVANLLNNLGVVSYEQADYWTAQQYYEESLNLRRELGNKRGIATSLNNLAMVYQMLGEYGEARALHEESLVLNRELGDKHGIANSLGNLGYIEGKKQNFNLSDQYYTESLKLHWEMGNKRSIAEVLAGMADLALQQVQYERAARLLVMGQNLRESLGLKIKPSEQAEYNQNLQIVEAQLGAATLARLRNETQAQSWQEAVKFALQVSEATEAFWLSTTLSSSL